ncbi:MAG: DDE-type integrase/transposase/recombinase [Oligoflexia bacterium]|nr:DDE-type integrase/transposase/recombinase [Oligoflexia bacterium]MBF0365901.1 DDE-type integrase/transposase/recombinase [Oligoflexia bacterium]
MLINKQLIDLSGITVGEISYHYDLLSRIVQKDHGLQAYITYSYDVGDSQKCTSSNTNLSIGKLTKVTVANKTPITIDYGYDERGNTTCIVKNFSGRSYKEESKYDILNRMLELTNPNGQKVSYRYKEDLTPSSIDGLVHSITYNERDQLESILYNSASGLSTNYAYDPSTLILTNIRSQTTNTAIQDISYQINSRGHIELIHDNISDHQSLSAKYQYDELGQLLSYESQGKISNYAYDPTGNFTLNEDFSNSIDYTLSLTSLSMKHGFMYLVAIIDWFSRYVLSWRLSNDMGVEFCIEALVEAIVMNGVPMIFNTDQGPQFTATAFVKTVEANGILMSMDGRGRALDNVFIERLWRSLKYEDVYLNGGHTDGREGRERPIQYFSFYNYERLHQSLGYKTPYQIYFEGRHKSEEGNPATQLCQL